jgi:hypothetical protein
LRRTGERQRNDNDRGEAQTRRRGAHGCCCSFAAASMRGAVSTPVQINGSN